MPVLFPSAGPAFLSSGGVFSPLPKQVFLSAPPLADARQNPPAPATSLQRREPSATLAWYIIHLSVQNCKNFYRNSPVSFLQGKFFQGAFPPFGQQRTHPPAKLVVVTMRAKPFVPRGHVKRVIRFCQLRNRCSIETILIP